MEVAADTIAFLTDDQGDLGVGLQPEQAVDDVDAFLLQGPGQGAFK